MTFMLLYDTDMASLAMYLKAIIMIEVSTEHQAFCMRTASARRHHE